MENRAVLSRSAPPPDAAIRYGDDPDQVADLWLSPRATDAVVILWHGGFWRSAFDRAHIRPMASELRDAGFSVVTPEYGRTDDSRTGWPATFEDVARASDLLPDLLVAEGITADRIVHAGHSAGGHLAVWAARRHRLPSGSPWRRDADARIAGVLALAPVLDLGEAHRLDLDGGAVAALLGGGPEDYPDRYATADPMRFGGNQPAIHILHGDADGRVPAALSRVYAAHGFGTLEELPGADHFAVIDPESAVWPRVVRGVRALAEPDARDEPEGRHR
ncbi:MAG: alpha/beta hydrolase [Thermomicrobiales bacterium]